jgi:DNA ligase (NAD+)
MKLLDDFGMNDKYKPLTIEVSADTDGFLKIYETFKNYRENECPFSLDGFVIKFPEDKRSRLGENSHHPHWAIAGKFPAKEVSTTIIDIIWSLGKDGSFCPKAKLEPVELLGTVVQYASLSNIGTMYKNKTYPGAKVALKKSGDIIPMITGILKSSKNEKEYDKEIEDFMKEDSK